MMSAYERAAQYMFRKGPNNLRAEHKNWRSFYNWMMKELPRDKFHNGMYYGISLELKGNVLHVARRRYPITEADKLMIMQWDLQHG